MYNGITGNDTVALWVDYCGRHHLKCDQVNVLGNVFGFTGRHSTESLRTQPCDIEGVSSHLSA